MPEPEASVAAALEAKLRERLGRMLQGAAADVAKYATAVSVDLAAAAAMQDERALRHLRAQAQMLGEKHRLQASRQLWAAAAEMIFDLGDLASAALGAAAGAADPDPEQEPKP